ncbi:hypothetical protein [Bacillus phage SP8]|uniref:Uncharacterized protein n=1 Tax=Bacillus phage Adastra TaxID=3143958 RepID=A0AAU8BDV4_9CAUD|nr:hypothetical protein [Bacillus phage SP8]
MTAPLIAITTYFYALISGGHIPHYYDESWALDEYEKPYVPYNIPAVINFSPSEGHETANSVVIKRHMKEGKVTIEGYYTNFRDIPKQKLTDEALELYEDYYENADESAMASGVFYFKYEGEEKGYALPIYYIDDVMFVPEEDVEKAQKIIEEQENRRK